MSLCAGEEVYDVSRDESRCFVNKFIVDPLGSFVLSSKYHRHSVDGIFEFTIFQRKNRIREYSVDSRLILNDDVRRRNVSVWDGRVALLA